MEGEGEMDMAGEMGGPGDTMSGGAGGGGYPQKDEHKSFTVTGFQTMEFPEEIVIERITRISEVKSIWR